MGKRILVTGASGFVGSHLALGLAKAGHNVVALGQSRQPPRIVTESVEAVSQGDLSEKSFARELVGNSRPEVIVHAAAWADAAGCELDPDRAHAANVQATKNLVDACRNLPDRIPLFIFLSTDLVFDSSRAPAGGFTEDAPAVPCGVYAQTKRQAEKIVCEAELAAFAFRLSLVYGEKIEQRGGFMGWLRGELDAGREATVFIDEYRSAIFVNDVLVALTRFIAANPKPDWKISLPRLFHLGGPERLSRQQFAEQVVEHFHYDRNLLRPVSRQSFPGKMPRPEDVSLNSARLWSSLGTKPRRLQEALREFV